MYISLLRSRLDYGSFIYGNNCKAYLCKLGKARNQAMRIVGGFIKMTPINVISTELTIKPLDTRKCYLAGIFLLKCKSLLI